MDFISLFTSASPSLVQFGYICLLIWIVVRYIPTLNKDHAKEREAIAKERQEREDKFLSIIESYRETLENFQEKEDESHQQLITMINECRTNTAREHEQIMRGMKIIAKKTGADLIE